jgi:hypothetical protein
MRDEKRIGWWHKLKLVLCVLPSEVLPMIHDNGVGGAEDGSGGNRIYASSSRLQGSSRSKKR